MKTLSRKNEPEAVTLYLRHELAYGWRARISAGADRIRPEGRNAVPVWRIAPGLTEPVALVSDHDDAQTGLPRGQLERALRRYGLHEPGPARGRKWDLLRRWLRICYGTTSCMVIDNNTDLAAAESYLIAPTAAWGRSRGLADPTRIDSAVKWTWDLWRGYLTGEQYTVTLEQRLHTNIRAYTPEVTSGHELEPIWMPRSTIGPVTTARQAKDLAEHELFMLAADQMPNRVTTADQLRPGDAVTQPFEGDLERIDYVESAAPDPADPGTIIVKYDGWGLATRYHATRLLAIEPVSARSHPDRHLTETEKGYQKLVEDALRTATRGRIEHTYELLLVIIAENPEWDPDFKKMMRAAAHNARINARPKDLRDLLKSSRLKES